MIDWYTRVRLIEDILDWDAQGEPYVRVAAGFRGEVTGASGTGSTGYHPDRADSLYVEDGQGRAYWLPRRLLSVL